VGVALFSLAVVGMAPALAQPMDPSMMSGLARPDASLGEGVVTVRVLRGHDFDHPVGGQDVALLVMGADGSVRRLDQMTDPDAGRATFNGVPTDPGTQIRVATVLDGALLFSHPFSMMPQVGTATMLVGPAAGEAPSTAPAVPPMQGMQMPTPEPGATPLAMGQTGDTGVVVKNQDKPAAGVAVTLERAEPQAADGSPGSATLVVTIPSDAQGVAFFRGLQPGSIYLASAAYQGSTFVSVPFSPSPKGAIALPLAVEVVRQDASQVAIGFEMTLGHADDDELEVIERLELGVRGQSAFDPGTQGLLVPLPAGFHSADLGNDVDPTRVKIDEGQGLRISGRFEPMRGNGQNLLDLTVGFLLPVGNSSHVILDQAVPAGIAGMFGMAATRADGSIQLSADAVPGVPPPTSSFEPRPDGNGQELVIDNLAAPAGGAIRLQIDGLPTRDKRPRYVAAAIAVLVLLVGIGLAATGSARSHHLHDLRHERDRLLDEILALERSSKPDAADKRAAIEGRLERVLRELDGEANA
jgi:hypothetical protein